MDRITVDRFWSKVDKSSGPDGCWVWNGKPNADGYGIFYLNNSSCMAHRFSWELLHGKVPRGFEVCHSCDNPPCVNPQHLWLGTHLENVHDRDIKGRQASHKGNKNGRAVLNEDGVRKIKKLRADGIQYKEIAKMMSVSEGCVNHILNGRHWSWVE